MPLAKIYFLNPLYILGFPLRKNDFLAVFAIPTYLTN